MCKFFEDLSLYLHLPFQVADLSRTLDMNPLQAYLMFKHWHGNTVTKSNKKRLKYGQSIAKAKAENKRNLKQTVLLLAHPLLVSTPTTPRRQHNLTQRR
jgi:hypothetical protein